MEVEMTNNGSGSLLGTLFTWVLILILAAVAIKIALWILGVAIGVTFFVLFTVAPLLVIGWIVMKILQSRSSSY
jgi:hypothetical protein